STYDIGKTYSENSFSWFLVNGSNTTTAKNKAVEFVPLAITVWDTAVNKYVGASLTDLGKVNLTPVTGLEGPSSVETFVGDNARTSFYVKPIYATMQTLYYASYDENIATISDTGMITGVNPGTVDVICVTKDAGYYKRIPVTVTEPVYAQSISFNKNQYELTAGEIEQTSVSFTPLEAQNTDVKYSSSNENVAKIDANGTIVAVAEGETTITVSTKKQVCTSSATVTVRKIPNTNNAVREFAAYIIKNGIFEQSDDKGLVHKLVRYENVYSGTPYITEFDYYPENRTISLMFSIMGSSDGGYDTVVGTTYYLDNYDTDNISVMQLDNGNKHFAVAPYRMSEDKDRVPNYDWTIADSPSIGDPTFISSFKDLCESYSFLTISRWDAFLMKNVNGHHLVDLTIPDVSPVNDKVIRLSGKNRYQTSLKAADVMKEELGVDQFNTVILATGENFADALGGGYLASKHNAPILLTKPTQAAAVNEYIRNNLVSGGTVYVLGGDGAVPESCLAGLEGFNIRRLSGKNRYATNIAILNEAGVTDEDILIVTGANYADSLSASSTGRPMLLVNGKNTSLNDTQRAFLEEHRFNTFYIIGGTGAVSAAIEEEVNTIRKPVRLSGKGRQETSALIAAVFFSNPDRAILAYSDNYPDGLCAGPLGFAIKAPVLLIKTGKESSALGFVSSNDIHSGYITGGTAAVSDDSARLVFSMTDGQEIETR
ncbi:MAG: cell wall-binding repeat-containing protein, partial [Erysipelotrichaceae bacterium]|nr:cell wall-binding repeat-containing protein [Erysipelotrichaceae bacterium]